MMTWTTDEDNPKNFKARLCMFVRMDHQGRLKQSKTLSKMLRANHRTESLTERARWPPPQFYVNKIYNNVQVCILTWESRTVKYFISMHS